MNTLTIGSNLFSCYVNNKEDQRELTLLYTKGKAHQRLVLMTLIYSTGHVVCQVGGKHRKFLAPDKPTKNINDALHWIRRAFLWAGTMQSLLYAFIDTTWDCG